MSYVLLSAAASSSDGFMLDTRTRTYAPEKKKKLEYRKGNKGNTRSFVSYFEVQNTAAACAVVPYSNPDEEMRKGSKRPKATQSGR